jgi:hypothetical protein
MILAFRRPCADHQAALLAFVDRRERSAATPAALAHLDRCQSCERELADVALAVAAMRRLGHHVRDAEPTPEAWLRLRDRVTRRVDPWQWRATLGGLASSAFLVALLIVPVTVGGPGAMPRQPDSAAAIRQESAYLANARIGTLHLDSPVAAVAGSVPVNLPREIRQVRKEVPAAPSVIRRTTQPI